MKRISATKLNETVLCPSAQPDMAHSMAFGVIDGTVEEPHVTPLIEPLPVTEELLDIAYPVAPTEFFRFAAPCANSACGHFDGSNCTLARKVVQYLPVTSESLPPCQIRSSCRWFQQEGKAVCLVCPQIMTYTDYSTELSRKLAPPSLAKESGWADVADPVVNLHKIHDKKEKAE